MGSGSEQSVTEAALTRRCRRTHAVGVSPLVGRLHAKYVEWIATVRSREEQSERSFLADLLQPVGKQVLRSGGFSAPSVTSRPSKQS